MRRALFLFLLLVLWLGSTAVSGQPTPTSADDDLLFIHHSVGSIWLRPIQG